MADEVTAALVDLYDADDWLLNANFRALFYLGGLGALPRGAPILDCGCATGRFMQILAHAGFANVSGIDASAEMVKLARARTGRTIVLGDVLRLSERVGEGAFEAVTAMNLQHHLGREPEWERFLGEVHRVLKPGGWLIAREPYPTPLFRSLWWLSGKTRLKARAPRILRMRLESLARERELLGHFIVRWPEVWREQLERQGFRVTRSVLWVGHRIVVARALGSARD